MVALIELGHSERVGQVRQQTQTLTLVHGAGVPPELAARLQGWHPGSHLGQIVKACFRYLPPALAGELLDSITRCVVLESSLAVVLVYGPHGTRRGRRDDLGIVSRKLVTTAGVGYLVDAFQNLVEPENLKYHGIGTGVAAEAVGDTALGTELTTEYNPNSTRATGTTTESAANIYQTVGTNTLDSGTPAITEHGILSQAATGGGTLLDRSVFAAINLVGANGDGLQTDYRLTCSAGG